ncbi:hypothetical protein [Roseomonas elaeocarpi]|uniref:Uncharacterized protein n=1 Tax=Roseomonas elaeocarpi TaxID=907779 RepID=A0ABV6K1M5_9PROT
MRPLFRPRLTLPAGLLAAAILLCWAVFLPDGTAAAGWLVGLVFTLGIALGALVLSATAALTGGRWEAALWPALGPATAGLVLFLPLAAPLLFLVPAGLYPWAARPELAMHPDVAAGWLNGFGFGLRGFVALALWAVLGPLILLLRGAARTLVAALALPLHFVALTVVATDWVLSADPRFHSTAFPMEVLVMQILAALSWAAALRPTPAGEAPGRAGDLAGLMIAAALGVLYLSFEQYLTAWYGDVPDKARWFLARQGWGWGGLLGLATLLASVLPVAAGTLRTVRRSPRWLARVGLAALLGLLLHWCWIILPPFGATSILAAALGTVAVGGLWLGLMQALIGRRLVGDPTEGLHHAV